MNETQIIQRKAAVFLLKRCEKHELIDKEIACFEREIAGQKVTDEEWDDLDLARDLDLDLGLVEYLLPLLGNRVPKFKNLNQRILTDITRNGYSLEMVFWYSCGTTHCIAGFDEMYAGDEGGELVKYFGNWLAGALIHKKSTGEIPDFYATNKEAIEYLTANATLNAEG